MIIFCCGIGLVIGCVCVVVWIGVVVCLGLE